MIRIRCRWKKLQVWKRDHRTEKKIMKKDFKWSETRIINSTFGQMKNIISVSPRILDQLKTCHEICCCCYCCFFLHATFLGLDTVHFSDLGQSTSCQVALLTPLFSSYLSFISAISTGPCLQDTKMSSEMRTSLYLIMCTNYMIYIISWRKGQFNHLIIVSKSFKVKI